MVMIFQTSDSASKILSQVLVDNLAGISGGRISVRRLLAQVAALAEVEGLERVAAHSTYNHPDTELALIYDSDLFSLNQAQEILVAAYERKQQATTPIKGRSDHAGAAASPRPNS